MFAHLVSLHPASFSSLSLQAEGGMRLHGKRRRETPPFSTRQKPRKPEKERQEGEEEREGERGEREMVSQNLVKKQVEEKGGGGVVNPQCQRQLMDKRACDSLLGGQTHFQTHGHQTHEGKEKDERGRLCSLRAHLAECYCCKLF